MPDFSLESELQRRAKKRGDGPAKMFWHQYEAMKKLLESDYYPWVQANCQWYTDHGAKHIASVRHAVDRLLENTKPQILEDVDLFVLLSAIIWHDVGMVFGRSDHAAQVADLTEGIRGFGLTDPTIHRVVVELAKAHSGQDGLRIPKHRQDCTPTPERTSTIYPRALAALLRFGDEVSENRSRVSLSLLPTVPPENRLYWEYANCVVASKPEPSRERVVVSIEMDRARAVEEFKCPSACSQWGRREPKISLIEYMVFRLQKLNSERAYCGAKFAGYVSMSRVDVRIEIQQGTDTILALEPIVMGDSGLAHDTYPSIEIYSDFFERHPNLKPSALAGMAKS